MTTITAPTSLINDFILSLELDTLVSPNRLLTQAMSVITDFPVGGLKESDLPLHLALFSYKGNQTLMYLGKVNSGDFKPKSTGNSFEISYELERGPVQYVFVNIDGSNLGNLTRLAEHDLENLALISSIDDNDVAVSVLYQMGVDELLKDFRCSDSVSWEIVSTENIGFENIFSPMIKYSAASPMLLPFQAYRFVDSNPFDSIASLLTIYVANATVKVSNSDLADFKKALHTLTQTSKFGFVLDDSHSILLKNPVDTEGLSYLLQPKGPRKIGSQQLNPLLQEEWVKAVSTLDWDHLKNKEIDGWLMDDVLGAILANMKWFQINLVATNARYAWIS